MDEQYLTSNRRWADPTMVKITSMKSSLRFVAIALFVSWNSLWVIDYVKAQSYQPLLTAWNSTGELIATVDGNGTLSILNATTLTNIFVGPGSYRSLSWSSTGNLLAGGDANGDVIIWDVTEQNITAITTIAAHQAPVYSLDWSIDGGYLATSSFVVDPGGGIYTTRIWDTNANYALAIEAVTGTLYQLRWSSASNKLAVASPQGLYTLDIDSLNGPRPIVLNPTQLESNSSVIEDERQVYSVAYSPSGEQIIYGTLDGSVNIYDVANDVTTSFINIQPNASIGNVDNHIRSVHWATDNTAIGILYGSGLLEWRSLSENEILLSIQTSSDTFEFAVQPNGQALAYLSDSGVEINSVVQQSQLRLTSLCSPSPDTIRVWRVRNTNPDPVDFTWDVVGTDQTGFATVPGGSVDNPGEVTFETVAVDGPNTTRIFVNGEQQDVKASTPDACEPDIPYTVQPLSVCWVDNPNDNSSAWEVTNPNPIPLQSSPEVKVLYDWEVSDSSGVIQSGQRAETGGPTRYNTPLGEQFDIRWYLLENGQPGPIIGQASAQAIEADRCPS